MAQLPPSSRPWRGQQAEPQPPVADAVTPHTTQRDGSYASWGRCRRRAASSGHVTRSVSPGWRPDPGRPLQARGPVRPITAVVRFAAGRDPGPGDRSMVGGAATLGRGRATRRGWHERLTGPPVDYRLLQHDAPPDGLPHAPTQLIEMRVEPGHDLATLPAIVLADLVERRSGSLAGGPV